MKRNNSGFTANDLLSWLVLFWMIFCCMSCAAIQAGWFPAR